MLSNSLSLLSQASSLWLPSGHSGPVLALLVADAGVWGTLLLGVGFRHVICGFYLFFLPVRLPSKIRKLPPDPPVRGFPGVWKLPLLRLPSRDGSLSLVLLSLFLIFYILPYLPLKALGCFSGRLMSSASSQKLFCEVFSAFKCSFDEFVGEKVVSLSYSSAILAPLPLQRALKTQWYENEQLT